MTGDKTLYRFTKIQAEEEGWSNCCKKCGSVMVLKPPIDKEGGAIRSSLFFYYCDVCDIFRLFSDEDPS